jgi:predicted nuclease of restriction endonuclease-like (RecB) superfamily
VIKLTTTHPPDAPAAVDPTGLLAELRELINSARQRVATVANAEQTLLYWRIGKRIAMENLTDGRAEYGKQILATVSQELMNEFGKGFGEKNVRRMIQFAEVFPDETIVVSLIRELTWTHFIALIPLKDPLAREFYAEMCRVERWPVRTLRQKIGGMLYERTALSKNTEAVIKGELEVLRDGRMTPEMVFRDPYLLDFLGLQGAFSEKDLENAILREMEKFLLELGSGFTFVARQKRISVGKDDFYLDLLFYHRYLRRLVAIELKLEPFQPAHMGQMELYLRWLDKHDKAAGEESPIGLILCAGSDAEQVELLQLNEKSIRVSEYLTELPPVELLQSRLHFAIELAREQAARRSEETAGVES